MRIVRFRIGDKTRYSGTPFSASRRGRRRYPARQVVLRGRSREHAAELGARPSWLS
jgi:hypothetical protein